MSSGYFIACLLAWGMATFAMKIVGERLDPMTLVGFNLLGYVVVSVFFVPKMALGITRFHILAVAIGVMFAIGNLAFYKLSQTHGVSLLAPLTALYVAIPVILGILVLGEPMTVRKGLGILLAVGAIYLLSSA
jgi:bacterial/archaeal transporter family protein